MMNAPACTLRRWARIFILGLVGGLAYVILSRSTIRRTGWLQVGFLASEAWDNLVLSIGLSTIIVRILLFYAPLRASYLRPSRILAFPTLWLAPAIAVAAGWTLDGLLLQLGSSRAASTDAMTFSAALAALLASAIAATGWATFSAWLRQSPEAPAHLQTRGAANAIASPTPVDEFERWLLQESPIRDQFEDELNVTPIARRVARRLMAAREPNVGVVGPFGSGKSSLLNLVEQHVATLTSSKSPVWLCRVSAWGFSDAQASLRYILDAAVETLSLELDTSSMVTVPDDYVSAVSDTTGWGRILQLVFPSRIDPISQLKRFSAALEAVGARLIIVLEDLERTNDREFDREQVLAALFQLRDVKNVAFVLSGSEALSHADPSTMSKLCDEREDLPRVDEQTASALVQKLNHCCKSKYSDIDPAPDERQAEVVLDSMMVHIYGPQHPLLLRSIVALLHTPRTLKHALRRTYTAWDTLHGEVDFLDLLVLNVLRFGAPQAFAFLKENITALRLMSAERESSDRERGWQRAIDGRWNSAMEEAEFDITAAAHLVAFLLPQRSDSEAFPRVYQGTSNDAPQGIRNSGRIDYFNRILSEELPANQARDQDILVLVDSAHSDETLGQLAQRMHESGSASDAWEHFAYRFPTTRLLALAGRIIDLEIKKGADAQGEQEGLLSAWRVANRRPGEHPGAEEWLVSNATMAQQISIKLAHDIAYYWTSTKYPIVAYDQASEVADSVREAMFRAAQRDYPKLAGPGFANLFSGRSSVSGYELFHFIFPPGGERDGYIGPFRSPGDWSWLAATILDAVEARPSRMTLRLLRLIQIHGRGDTVLGFDNAILSGMFGETARNVVGMILENIAHLPSNERINPAKVAALAREWLSQNGGTSKLDGTDERT